MRTEPLYKRLLTILSKVACIIVSMWVGIVVGKYTAIGMIWVISYFDCTDNVVEFINFIGKIIP